MSSSANSSKGDQGHSSFGSAVNQGSQEPKDELAFTAWWIIGSACAFTLGIVREVCHFLSEFRSADLFIYLSAGVLGMSIAHYLMKRGTQISRELLQSKMEAYLKELEGQMHRRKHKLEEAARLSEQAQVAEATKNAAEKAASGKTAGDKLRSEADNRTIEWQIAAEDAAVAKAQAEQPFPLPMQYIISRLGDESSAQFGYFGRKLASRDPRLLLDLLLDEAVPADKSHEVSDLKKRIVECNTARQAVAEEEKEERRRRKSQGRGGPQSEIRFGHP